MEKQQKCIGKCKEENFFRIIIRYLLVEEKICMTDHFQPLWARNVPRFGIAHALALGVSIIDN